MKVVSTVYLHGYSGDKLGLTPIMRELGFERSVSFDLPGFGESNDLPEVCRRDIRLYAECVWTEIRRLVPEGTIRLVGHSHGAMVAFTLAHQHPDEVESLVLLCPVATPRRPARSLVRLLQRASTVVDARFLTWAMRRRLLVDAVSLYSMQRNWPSTVRRRIFATRRREAGFYRPAMIDMFAQTLTFAKDMKEVQLTQPVALCYAKDDNVADKRDAQWYVSRAPAVHMVAVRGGHLVVIAEAEMVARELRASGSLSFVS